MAIPAAPKGLNVSGRALWRSVLSEYELDQHELLLLKEAARCADRLDRLEAASAAGPITTTNRHGDEVVHPCLVEARQASLTMARLLSSLRLPSGDEADSRPQRRGGARGVYRRQSGLRSVTGA